MSKIRISYLCDRCKNDAEACEVCDRGSRFVEAGRAPEVAYGYFYHTNKSAQKRSSAGAFDIMNVIFNEPATIVMWMDGTKTVVKCQEGDIFDPEMGLAMAIAKKAMGNTGAYNEVFKKWLPEEKKDKPEILGQVVGAETNDRGVIARIVFGTSEAAQKLKESIAGVQTALSFHVNEEDK